MPNSNAIRCEGCGVQTDTIDLLGICLNCQNLHVQSSIEVANTALELIESVVRTALDRGHAHPEDVLATVGRVIVEEGEPSARTNDILRLRSDRVRRDLSKRGMT